MRRALAIGFFDGVHRGHREILADAASVITFANHPLTVLSPDSSPKMILSAEERLAAIRSCGVEKIEMLNFSRDLASVSPDEFAERYLRPELLRLGDGSYVRCGANWRFGSGARGDADTLRKLGIRVEVVPYAGGDGEIVSSSRIRSAISEGRLDKAAEMLGRPYELSGQVVAGKMLGRAIGFPTVNVELVNRCPPLVFGVYAVSVEGRYGVANYGFAPTMGADSWSHPVLEIHFLETPPEGEELKVAFEAFVRPERAFGSLEELKSQISADIANVANHIKGKSVNR